MLSADGRIFGAVLYSCKARDVQFFWCVRVMAAQEPFLSGPRCHTYEVLVYSLLWHASAMEKLVGGKIESARQQNIINFI